MTIPPFDYEKPQKSIEERRAAWKGAPADSAQEIERRRQVTCQCHICRVRRGERGGINFDKIWIDEADDITDSAVALFKDLVIREAKRRVAEREIDDEDPPPRAA